MTAATGIPPRSGRLVVGDGDDRGAVTDGPVVVAEFALKWSVIGGDHRKAGETVGIYRPDQRVVVDEVSSGRGLVRVDDVAQLGSRAPHPDTYGPGQH